MNEWSGSDQKELGLFGLITDVYIHIFRKESI